MMASGASGDGHGCCLRSLTALGFHYDHMSPYSEKLSSRCVPFQRRRVVPVQVPLRYWLVGGSAAAVSVWVSGVGPGAVAAVVLGGLVASASTGPGGAPMGGATVVVPPGRAAASFRLAFAVCAFAAFTAWRPRLETASQPASRPRPTSGRHHGLRAEVRRCLDRCRDITSTSALADQVALLFPWSRGIKRTTSPMAWRQPGKLRLLPPADPHRRRPRPWVLASPPAGAEGWRRRASR